MKHPEGADESYVPKWSLSPNKENVARRTERRSGKRREGRAQPKEQPRTGEAHRSERNEAGTNQAEGEESLAGELRCLEESRKRLNALNQTTATLKEQMEMRTSVDPAATRSIEFRRSSHLYQSCTQLDVAKLNSVEECQKYLRLYKNKLRKEREEKHRLALQAQEICLFLRPLLEHFGHESPEKVPFADVQNLIANLEKENVPHATKVRPPAPVNEGAKTASAKPPAKPVMVPESDPSPGEKTDVQEGSIETSPRGTVKELASALEAAIEELQRGTDYLHQRGKPPLPSSEACVPTPAP